MSRSVIVAALVAITALVTAAVLFTTGDDAMQRLAILVGFAAPVSVGLVAAIRADAAADRADAAATSTDNTSAIAQALNGGFEARVRHANRETAAETGTYLDQERAIADADTAAALSSAGSSTHPPDPPIVAT